MEIYNALVEGTFRPSKEQANNLVLGSFEQEFEKINQEYIDKLVVADKFIEQISKVDAELVIFGAGAAGNVFWGRLGEFTSKLVAFCDNYKTGIVEKLEGSPIRIPIISPERMVREHKNAIIVIATGAGHGKDNQIYDQLLALGFLKERIFKQYGIHERYSIEVFNKLYLEGYRWAYNFFEDEISKQIILNRIRNYLFFYEMPHSVPEDQYFESDVMQFTDKEIFIDAGLYIGDTALEFVKRVNDKFTAIYGFEPDEENYKKAINDLSSYENVKLFNKGLYSKTDVLSFDSNASNSRVNSEGKLKIPVVSLDEIFNRETLLPTFIKMDIEGSEKEALIGAKQTITKARPKLAICVYHKPEDIYELPRVINELGDYSCCLRHYSCDVFETVMYAVPN